MSSIASLEAELSRQRSINAQLRGELNTIEYGVRNAHNRLEQFNNKICTAMENSRNYMDDSARKLAAAVETQAEIERLYIRFKAMEMANKRIRECNNKKFYDFANYTKVRKLVQGMMDNLDLNMVSDRVIYKSVERQHLQTPDYWLTCVLLSIMAWKNDDKELADRAMQIALELDKKGCCIFYMLFNLRMDREDAALKWFMEYQNCELKGSDQRTFLLLFALISKCINSSEELSAGAREEIDRFIRRVVDHSIRAQGYSREAMVDLVLEHLRQFTPSEQLDYPLMRKHCSDCKHYQVALNHAKGNVAILEYFRSVIHVQPEQRNSFIKSFIDELIASANAQEKAVYEEIEYNETIIRMEGDVDKAKEIFGAKKVHDEKEMNLIYEMIEWVYGADAEDVNDQSRLNMFTLTKDLQRDAVEQRAATYRGLDRSTAQFKMGEYGTTIDFRNLQGEKAKAENFYRGKRDEELAAVKDWPAYVGFGIGVAALVACFFVGWGLLVGTVGGAGFGVIKLLLNKNARKDAESRFQENCRLMGQLLDGLYAEKAAYEEEFASFDVYMDEIARELDFV